MKSRSIFRSFVLICAVLAISTSAMADARPGAGLIRDHFLNARLPVREVARNLAQQPTSPEGISASAPGLKSPGKALLFSAVVPGAGEFYVGAKKRGIGFLALEVASWTWYFTQHSAGKDKENEYMDFADAEWTEATYLNWYRHWEEWYDARKGDNDPDFDMLFTHHLPGDPNDDYYEMIGKYDQFAPGWIGDPVQNPPEQWAPNDTILGLPTNKPTTADICRGGDAAATVNRDKYTNLRGDANDLLKRATWGISASLFNHVISALDAALVAKSNNRRVMQEARYPQLRMNLDRYAGEVIPMITVTQRF